MLDILSDFVMKHISVAIPTAVLAFAAKLTASKNDRKGCPDDHFKLFL